MDVSIEGEFRQPRVPDVPENDRMEADSDATNASDDDAGAAFHLWSDDDEIDQAHHAQEEARESEEEEEETETEMATLGEAVLYRVALSNYKAAYRKHNVYTGKQIFSPIFIVKQENGSEMPHLWQFLTDNIKSEGLKT